VLRLFPAVWFVLSVAPFLFVFFGLLFFFFCFQVSSSSLPIPLLCFFRSPLFLPSPSFYLFLSLSSVFSFFLPVSPLFFFFFFSLPFLLRFFSLYFQRSWPLFIEAKDAVFYSSHGGQSAGRPLGAAAEVRWVVRGGWSAIVSGRWAPGESGRQKFKKKQPFLLLPRCVIGGRR